MVKHVFLFWIPLFLLSACQPSVPKDALLLSPESLANRQLQTRRFETTDNKAMLRAAAAVMQDLGFTLDESESTLGILVGSKRRDATSGSQIAGSLLIALLGGAPPPLDKEQLIRVSMVMREIAQSVPAEEPHKTAEPLNKPKKAVKAPAVHPAEAARKTKTTSSGQSTVRVTFQRIIINTANQVTRTEQINDPEIYKKFFDKLSQSVFLEAHEI